MLSRVAFRLLAGPVLIGAGTGAQASPGLGDGVFSADIDQGSWEAGIGYDALTGGPDDGADAITGAVGYAPDDRLKLALTTVFESDAGAAHKLMGVGFEGVYRLNPPGDLGIALYGGYEITPNGPDAVETRLVLQRRAGPWDLRMNLIAGKDLDAARPLEVGYAASADVAATDTLRLGAQAYGGLGTLSDFLPNAEHAAGPVAILGIAGSGPQIEVQLGYLFALGEARDSSNGQLRLALGAGF